MSITITLVSYIKVVHPYSVALSAAIVDLLDNVLYGEVFVALTIDASQGCTTIRLGFTSFGGTWYYVLIV